ncbi:MAG: DUF58 domain-containing protein [bacterium]
MSTVSIGSRFRWNPSGIAVFLAGIAVLGAGILRTEPVTLLFGGALTALVLYTTLAGSLTTAVTARRLRRQGVQVELALDPDEVYSGESLRLAGTLHARMLGMPGFLFYVVAVLEGPGGRRLFVDAPIRLRRSARIDEELGGVRRGHYLCETGSFRIRDLLGLTHGVVSFPLHLEGWVRPAFEAPPIPFTRGADSGGERLVTPIRRRTDELLETRRYVPGDDIRRVNWKMYARWGELLVRIGEEAPPPQGAHHCILLLGAPGAASIGDGSGVPEGGRRAAEASALLCDRLVALFGGYCTALHQLGVTVTAEISGGAEALRIEASQEREFERRLSGVWWHREATPPAEPPYRQVTLFAAPGAAGLSEHLAALGRSRVLVDVVMVVPVASDPESGAAGAGAAGPAETPAGTVTRAGTEPQSVPTGLSGEARRERPAGAVLRRVLFVRGGRRSDGTAWASQIRRMGEESRNELPRRSHGVRRVEVV